MHLLLQHRPATSFIDLRTVNNTILQHMYYQATVALLLIDHDNEGFLALHKTTQSFCMPGQLRFFLSNCSGRLSRAVVMGKL